MDPLNPPERRFSWVNPNSQKSQKAFSRLIFWVVEVLAKQRLHTFPPAARIKYWLCLPPGCPAGRQS
jgi:hypothetical protein